MTPSADTPLWVAGRYLLRVRYRTFTACLDSLLRSSDPEAFHDLRVASRRLRETISVVSPCYPDPSLAIARRRVRRVTQSLGGIRNIDEARAFFSAIDHVPSTIAPSLAAWLESLTETRARICRSLLASLEAFDRKGMKRLISSALDHPALLSGGGDPTIPVAAYVASVLGERGTLVRDAARLLETDTESREEGMHRLRIALKKFRYVFELAGPFARHGYDALLARLKEYQDTLGELNDTAVFHSMVAESGLPSDVVLWMTNLLERRRSDLLDRFALLRNGSPLETLSEDAVALVRT